MEAGRNRYRACGELVSLKSFSSFTEVWVWELGRHLNDSHARRRASDHIKLLVVLTFIFLKYMYRTTPSRSNKSYTTTWLLFLIRVSPPIIAQNSFHAAH